MTTADVRINPGASRTRSSGLTDVKSRNAKPVKWWALVGAFWLAVTAFAWGNWLLSGHAKPTPMPVDPPTFHVIFIRAWEAIMVIGAIATIRHFIWKPWRRERRLTFDGMFIISWLATWMIQDPLLNYTAQWFNYSSAFLNLGCPQCHIPGWQSPGQSVMTEPLLFMPGMYISALFGWCVLCNRLMAAAKRKWPAIGTFGLIMVAAGCAAVFDFFAELAWLRTGTYVYGGAIRDVTLFSGHYYQYPIYEMLLAAVFFAAVASFRYFKNDKGQTVAERGIDEVKATPKQKTLLRLVAVIGMTNTLLFVSYNIPAQWLGTHADNFPNDVLDKPYLTNTMCGPGTDYACPGPQVPIRVGADSGHATPDGRLVAPSGLPNQETPK